MHHHDDEENTEKEDDEKSFWDFFKDIQSFCHYSTKSQCQHQKTKQQGTQDIASH